MQKNQEFARVLLGTDDLHVDTVIPDLNGHRVWLKESFTSGGKRLGVIDCCLESNPCAWHGAEAKFSLCDSALLKQKQ